MEVRAHDDPSAWLEAVLPLLMLDEARHDLCLGLVHTLVHHPSVYPSKYLWSVEDAGTVVGAALQTPPHNLILGQPSAEGANDLLADAIESAGIQLPGVVGGLPEAEAFAVAWCARTGNTARRVMGQGIYSLTEVLPVPAVAGTPRTARPDDLNLVAGWIQAFQDEVVPDALRSDPEERRRRLGSILGSDEEGICLWEAEDQVVSLSGFGGPTPNGIRIGPVYTPPALRGRGYATTLVADLSRRQLASGRRFCFLHTDLANPTSNAIYRRIGYRRVCDSVVLAFERA
ncbi:MAG: GNAT family N-acetyltransferase [Actinobacteria bacterium]|nr:MAG: GNAT family N-acetyltransferase [Actinomycetota bacterium]TMK23319.1 MAG: GNAT family N-acetyltransferase [Actinomycetota bacterium]TMK91206.1 MAG: GNAT family N-acetyltransferase [Actinomycetota bacterium]TMM22094.1 MAG: GNAT family N-acetyltransferase [Actinomycetota bacterium]